MLKKIVSSMPLVAAGLVLVGCSNSIPECGDSKATDSALEKMMNKMAAGVGLEAMSSISMKLDNVRTTNTNKETGKHECAAQLHASSPGREPLEIEVTYSVEATDTGKGFFVTVHD